MVASVPELTMRTSSIDGTSSMILRATIVSISVGRAEGQAVLGGLLHRADHRRIGVAEDHRAPGAHVVDELAAVGRPDPRALGAREEDRLAAHAAESAHGRVDPAGNVLAGFGEQAHG